MARSNYIYIVSVSSQPVAAFTVRHECRTWLNRRWDGRLPTNVTVLRTRDNDSDCARPQDVTLALFGVLQLTREA